MTMTFVDNETATMTQFQLSLTYDHESAMDKNHIQLIAKVLDRPCLEYRKEGRVAGGHCSQFSTLPLWSVNALYMACTVD